MTKFSTCVTMDSKGTYAVTFLIEHKGSNGPPGVGTVTCLATDTNSGTTPAVLVLGSRNGASGHRHDGRSCSSGEVGVTGVVDGGTTNQWCPLYPFPVRTIAGPKRTDHLVSSGSSPTSITEPHHFSVRPTNSVTSVLHTLSASTHMMSWIRQHVPIYNS